MKKNNINIYDGHFVYNGEVIDYYITDTDSNVSIGKMSRFIYFDMNGKTIDLRNIYGTDEEMTNITPRQALRWYVELLKKED